MGWGYPYYGAYYGGYPYYPYYAPYPYPYSYGVGYASPTYDDNTAIRLEVSPRNAQVFVDGYIAGTVDDFDGTFQRLRLRPGTHQIALYAEGYRTVVQSLSLAAGADQKISYKLEQLPAGETSEPPPVAAEPTQDQTARPELQRPAPGYGPGRDPGQGRGPAPGSVQLQTPDEAASRFGTLSIRVQPSDAEVLIDGERWAAPAGIERMVIHLGEGRHHVEVRKEGYSQYVEDILIRRSNLFTLNVSLLHGADGGK